MPRHRTSGLLILCLLTSLGGSPLLADDDDDGPTASRPSKPVKQKPGSVQLTREQQSAAGLISQMVSSVTLQNETTSFGKVLDIQPLLELRARLRAAQADVDVASAALKLAEKNRQRIQALYKADIIAGRELTQAEAQWQSDFTREQGARRHVEEIHREAQHVWGDALERLALGNASELLGSLTSHSRYLVQITLPYGTDPSGLKSKVWVARDFDRARAVPAEMISAAPQTDDLVQGETWFLHVPGEHLRAGMRINVWVTSGPGGRQGVSLPVSAIVWHAGKPWVYRDNRNGSYSRLAVDPQPAPGKALLIDTGLTPGTKVVVTGAQTLLSEEFRSTIPSEDDSR
ncbi:MAG: hypothetical protein K9K68_09995 [Methylococcaceae bacterium]|nr:hypothetical protein [Methylococcaceae bacterium]